MVLACACGGIGEIALLAWLFGSLGAWYLLVKTKLSQFWLFRWMRL